MGEIDDLLSGANSKADLLDSLREAQSMFVSWQSSDGMWHHGWCNAQFENVGHVQYAVYAFCADAYREAEDEP